MIPTTDPDFYRSLLDQMSDGVFFVDRNQKVLYWSLGAQRLTGYAAEEVVGRKCDDELLRHTDYLGNRAVPGAAPIMECLQDGHAREVKVYLQHKLGRRVPVSARVQPICDSEGGISGAIEIFRDDSAKSDSQRRIDAMRRMAFLDHLTQLPNRRFMEMALLTALNEYQMHLDPFGVLMMDIDHFKGINDTFGHRTGDKVLQEAARMLAASLRPDDLVGRWGGDEFIAIIRGMSPDALHDMAIRCATFAAHSSISTGDGRRITLTVSVGGATVQPGDTAEELVHRADQQMYLEKMQKHSEPEAKAS
ncbi:MAG TPA: diguanylate cyclase [Terracidiphilus sp.]|nr:diguanylate cyclase [Terracidiphilus sp.]